MIRAKGEIEVRIEGYKLSKHTVSNGGISGGSRTQTSRQVTGATSLNYPLKECVDESGQLMDIDYGKQFVFVFYNKSFYFAELNDSQINYIN